MSFTGNPYPPTIKEKKNKGRVKLWGDVDVIANTKFNKRYLAGPLV